MARKEDAMPLSDPVDVETAKKVEEATEKATFLATSEWLDQQKKDGLSFEHSEKPLWVRGSLVYVVNKDSYMQALRVKETVNVRSGN